MLSIADWIILYGAIYSHARTVGDVAYANLVTTYPIALYVPVAGDNAAADGWKIEVQKQLADAFGIEVMIYHYPTGASKWNPIEHRLFSEISKNWAGKPLRTFQTRLNYIRDTKTETGLKVKPYLVEHVFEKGVKYDLQERDNLNLIYSDAILVRPGTTSFGHILVLDDIRLLMSKVIFD